MQQKMLEDQQYTREFKKYEVDLKANTAIEVATISANKSMEPKEELVEDTTIQDEMARRKLQLDEFSTKHSARLDVRIQDEEERSNKAKEVIAKSKPKATK